MNSDNECFIIYLFILYISFFLCPRSSTFPISTFYNHKRKKESLQHANVNIVQVTSFIFTSTVSCIQIFVRWLNLQRVHRRNLRDELPAEAAGPDWLGRNNQNIFPWLRKNTHGVSVRPLVCVCAFNVLWKWGTISENVKVIKTNCNMREAWPVTCRLTSFSFLQRVPAPPGAALWLLLYLAVRQRRQTSPQNICTTTYNNDTKFTGKRRRLFSTLPYLAHPTVTGIAPMEGGGGCKNVTTGGGCQICQSVCLFVCEWRVCVQP